MAYAVTAALVVIVAVERVVAIWTGGRIPVSFDIMVAAGGLIITFSFENVTQTLLFGLGRAGGLAAVLLFRSALSLILVWVLAGIVGQEAALAGPLIAALLTSSWLLPLLVVRGVRAKARLQSGHQRRRPGGTAG